MSWCWGLFNALAAKNATQTLPIVGIGFDNPIQHGLIASTLAAGPKRHRNILRRWSGNRRQGPRAAEGIRPCAANRRGTFQRMG
jgi:hypothetical protein